MHDIAIRALNAAQQFGASYADVRVMERTTEGIDVKNGRVEGVSSATSSGFNVRVIVNGAWGFASSARLELAEAERVAKLSQYVNVHLSKIPFCFDDWNFTRSGLPSQGWGAFCLG